MVKIFLKVFAFAADTPQRVKLSGLTASFPNNCVFCSGILSTGNKVSKKGWIEAEKCQIREGCEQFGIDLLHMELKGTSKYYLSLAIYFFRKYRGSTEAASRVFNSRLHLLSLPHVLEEPVKWEGHHHRKFLPLAALLQGDLVRDERVIQLWEGF
ncbi:hypothetical protein ADUPG1_011566 [Aduncisulcus paluster]|uniref:Uncharacterized protein n=1 Tax=Aduncisulcus paluster TaxID=2918883 RepID=A0ABQ5JX14_9EUKA|nr:hypothetical protein ADUPG1_011566 [Aduncisulcus paluster]